MSLMNKPGPLIREFNRFIQERAPWAQFIVPFMNMSANAFRYAVLERSPLGVFLAQDIRDNLAGRNGNRVRDTQISRMIVGSAVWYGFYTLALKDLLSPSNPRDQDDADAWRLTGKTRNSVKVGGSWWQISHLGPIAHLAAIAADVVQIQREISEHDSERLTGLIMSSISHSLVHENWLRSPAELFQAALDPERYGDKWIQKEIASFVPFTTGMRQLVPVTDPYMREARTIVDNILSGIPYLSQNLLPKRDIWGEPVPTRDALGGRGVTAVYRSAVNNDPVNQELVRLGYFPGVVPRRLRGVELTDFQYDDLVRIGGRMAKQRLDLLVNMPGWNQIPAFARRELMKNAVDEQRHLADQIILARNPSILKAAIKDKLDIIGGAPPKKPIKQPQAP
jgi:hypothetical protein